MKYFLSLLCILLGFVLVWKTEWFLQNFGSIAWAEAHLGTEGGSRLMYKLIGIFLMFLPFLILTGVLGDIALSIFGGAFSS